MVQKLFLLLLTVTILSRNVICEDKCTERDLLPHTDNCQLFYICLAGGFHEDSCPYGLHFNAVTKLCDRPENANCAVKVATCADGELLPHEESCERYHICLAGSFHERSCLSGLHFNAVAEHCDWPENANCAVKFAPCVNGELRPHEESCERYHRCLAGSFHEFSCPSGLHFNAVSELCDWPENANCAVKVATCVSGEVRPHEESCELYHICLAGSFHEHRCPSGLHFNAVSERCDLPEYANCAVKVATCVDGELLPNEESCELFYVCSEGSLKPFRCPEGLSFNRTLKVCDFADNVYCARN